MKLKKLTSEQEWKIAEFIAWFLLAVVFFGGAYVMYKEIGSML